MESGREPRFIGFWSLRSYDSIHDTTLQRLLGQGLALEGVTEQLCPALSPEISAWLVWCRRWYF